MLGENVRRLGEKAAAPGTASPDDTKKLARDKAEAERLTPDVEPPTGCNPASTSLSAESNDPRTNRGNSNVHSNVPPYPGKGPTLGVFVAQGTEVPLTSGSGAPGSWLVQNLPGGTGSGLNAVIATHVERHAAAIMHKHCIADADLYINQAPCARSAQCRFNLHKILPAGSTLRVHFLGEDGTTVSCWMFVAGQPRWQIC